MKKFAHRQRKAAAALVTMVTLFAALTVLSACNTAAGLGKDTSAAGNAVTNTADKAKSGM